MCHSGVGFSLAFFPLQGKFLFSLSSSARELRRHFSWQDQK
jgi:hypothetical protein